MSSVEGFLETEEMAVVGQTFLDSVEHVLANYEGAGQTALRQFLVELMMKYPPYTLPTVDGVANLARVVWSDEPRRHFVLMISYTFFARWGHPAAKVKALANNLARGCAPVDSTDTHNAAPVDAGARMVNIDAASQIIGANKWLMIALMVPLFYSAYATGKPK